jgi:hypothetical protein
MKNFLKAFSVAFFGVLLIISCEKDIKTEPIDKESQKLVSVEEIATNMLDLMKSENSKNEIIDFLQSNKFGGSLETLMGGIDKTEINKNALSNLNSIIKNSEEINDRAVETGIVQIPELWLYSPKSGFKSSEVLISFAPKGDEKEWESIKAYDLNGNVVTLDPIEKPNVPVIVIELNGMESLKLRVELMNKELAAAGLQKRISNQKMLLKSTNGLETTKITQISLTDDKEPWIKGAAEIYGITSGIRGTSDNKVAEIQIVAMPYLDKDNQNYYPNQIVLFWDDYAYQAANIQLYEQDSNYNYKDLVKIIVDGVFEITGILTTQPWVSALGMIAGAIVEVMPDEWYTDNDDYVDSFYTIEKNRTYTDYYGAGANAKISLIPYFIPSN